MKKSTATITLLLGFFLSLQAQEASIKVEVSTDTVLLGNYFELKFTLENAGGKFEAPDLTGFDIVGGPNSSTSMSIINGQVKRSSSYSYYLRPVDIGSFTIPPAFVTTKEEVLETVPLEIVVIPNPDGIVQHPNRPGLQYDQYFRSPVEGKQDTTAPTRPRKRF